MISKEEKRARDNRRYAEHREEILARRRQRYAKRREEEHRRRHEKYLRNKEKEAAARRCYAESHSEELREKRRQYYLEHKELIAEKHAQYYAAHREEYIASSRQWRLAHPEAHRCSVRRSQAKHSEERRARKAEQTAELKFFQGLTMVSAVTAPMDEHLSEECRLRLAERELHKKEWRLEWQRRNRDRIRRRRDLDNVGGKALIDALQGAGLFTDDCQIKRISLEMLEPVDNGLCIIELENIDNEQKETRGAGGAGPPVP